MHFPRYNSVPHRLDSFRRVAYYSPNSNELFNTASNNLVYLGWFSTVPDLVYGAMQQSLVKQYDFDYLFTVPPCTCEYDDIDETYKCPSCGYQQDDGTCREKQEASEGVACMDYFAMPALVESRCSLPSGSNNPYLSGSNYKPIGCLTVAQMAAGFTGSGLVGAVANGG